MVSKMKELDDGIYELRAFIGPSIQQKSYEVGEEFYNRFLEQSESNVCFFKHGKERYCFDLPGYCAAILAEKGVKPINISPIDTYQDDRFYSFRHSQHKNYEEKERNISWIRIKA